MPIRPKRSTRSDRVVSCRMPSEHYERLAEAAAATDLSVSEFMRESVFGAVETTSAALDAAYSEGVRDAEADAQRHLVMVEAERDQERRLRTQAQQRVGQLEQELRITSARLINSLTRVLEHRSDGARGEVVRLWTMLDVAERERLFPAIATSVVETVHASFATASRPDPEQLLAVYRRARWLCDVVTPGPGNAEGPDPDVHAWALVSTLALRAAILVLLGWSLERRRHLHLRPTVAQPPVAPEVPPVAAALGDAVAQPLGADALEPEPVRREIQVPASTVPPWSQPPLLVSADFLECFAPNQWATSAEAPPQGEYITYMPSLRRRETSRGGGADRVHDGPRQAVSREGAGFDQVETGLDGLLAGASAWPNVDRDAVVIEGVEHPVLPGFDRVEQVAQEGAGEPDHPDAG